MPETAEGNLKGLRQVFSNDQNTAACLQPLWEEGGWQSETDAVLGVVQLQPQRLCLQVRKFNHIKMILLTSHRFAFDATSRKVPVWC